VGAEIVVGSAVLEVECDVLAPCALGGVLDGATVPRLRCRAICGAANNQLADDSIDGMLAAQGVLYAPDFIANAGGIINIAEEFVGYRRERAIARAEQVEHTTAAVFALGRERAITPGAAAVAMARARLDAEGRGRRWRPGDPAAWTHGEPLRHLRPRAA
jgi:leucine dehydrogenase